MSSDIYKYRRKLYSFIKNNKLLYKQLNVLKNENSELIAKNKIYKNMIQELTRSIAFYKKYFTIMHSNSSLSIDIDKTECDPDDVIHNLFFDNNIQKQKTKKIRFYELSNNIVNMNHKTFSLDNSHNSIEV